jgi:hypothetical protein
VPKSFALSLLFYAKGKGPVRETLGYLRRVSKAALLDVTLSDFVTRVHFDFFYNSGGPAGDSICDCRHKNRPGQHPRRKNKMENKLLRIGVAMASDRSGVPESSPQPFAGALEFAEAWKEPK